MNASGTSGAVVSNTPEPGLKRIPTVTFSDPKLVPIAPERSTHISTWKILCIPHQVRSRSNSTSPRPSVVVNTFNPINIEREGSISKTGEPTLLESVLEEAMSPNAVSNPLKRENIMTNMDPRLPQDDGKLHVLFGATGSLSVFKLKHMIRKLEEIYGRDKICIQVILTNSATKFFAMKYMRKNKKQHNSIDTSFNSTNSNAGNITGNKKKVASLEKFSIQKTSSNSAASQTNNKQEEEKQMASTTGFPSTLGGSRTYSNSSNVVSQHPQIELPAHIQFWTDQDEWDVWRQRTDPVLHIELRRWADILVVAPLTANTLAKIALGLCDNLLTNVIRAWNPTFPIFLAPSMGSGTFNSIMTKKHFRIIQEEMPWVTVFKPSEKVMGINGDIGLSGMMDANEIVGKINKFALITDNQKRRLKIGK
ncbi:AAC_collapsed_G0050140.mRNA.1.CDS.1 [Saccharomyces cerevisiae]|nr:AAC_collapsed_G0050140.mRNA.1.CDS.1 [Saccharomyces cerevisiae]